MLIPNRKIPKVAAAALVVGGCGGGGGGSAADRIAREACADWLDCDPADFNYYYSSIAECRDLVSADFQTFLDENAYYYGASCANAIIDAYDCFYQSYGAPTCDYYDAYYDCYDLIYDAYYLCY